MFAFKIQNIKYYDINKNILDIIFKALKVFLSKIKYTNYSENLKKDIKLIKNKYNFEKYIKLIKRFRIF